MTPIRTAGWLLLLNLALGLASSYRKLLPPAGSSPGASFGTSVALSNKVMAVGAFQDRNASGSVSLFGLRRHVVTLQAPEQAAKGSQFGCWLSSSSAQLAVGAQNDGHNASGAVYMYRLGHNEISLEAKLVPSHPVGYGYFGSTVSLAGSTLAVGAPAGAGTGIVYFYHQRQGSWAHADTVVIEAPNELAAGANFGQSVATLGITANETLVAIGANHARNTSGAVLLYAVSDSVAIHTATLRASDTACSSPGAYFGSSVAAATVSPSVSVVAAGAAFCYDGRGAVYLYVDSGSKQWVETVVAPPNTTSVGGFGSSIAFSHGGSRGLSLIVGAWQYSGTGAAFVYSISFDGHAVGVKLQHHLQPADLLAGAFFGTSIAMNDHAILVGADGVQDSFGAAYEFVVES